MKFLFYFICFCLIFFAGINGRFSDTVYAESPSDLSTNTGESDLTTPDKQTGQTKSLDSLTTNKDDSDLTGPEEQTDQGDEPVTQEMIDQEEEQLEQKLREINETPVEEFGSLVHKNKERAAIAFKLKLLRENPEKYFKEKKGQ